MHIQEKILLWSNNFWMFSDGLLGPLFAVFTEKIGGDILDISYAWAIYMIVTGVLTIYVGKVSDKIGHEKLLIAGYALNAFFTFAFIFVDNPLELFLVQAGMGLSLALATPTWFALFDRYSDKQKDGYLWGSEEGQGSIATGIAILCGGVIVSMTSFTVLFVLMGILQTAGLIMQVQMFRHSRV